MGIDDVLEAAAGWVAPEVRRWSSRWKDDLRAWLEPDVALVGDALWGAQGRDIVGLPVADPLLWANRIVDLPGGAWALTGIRFRGRDVSKPFVDVIATSVRPDASGFAALDTVVSAYEPFAPLCFRVHAPWGAASAALDGPGRHVRADQLVVEAPVREIRGGVAIGERVSLTPIAPAAAADRVSEIYDALRAERPGLDEWAVPADAESLEAASEEGLLHAVLVDGVPAGVIAAEREDAYGSSGFCVQEIAIDGRHRGRGIGAAALRHLAEILPARESDLLWGRIHPRNTASLRNALAVGRRIVSAHLWVTPDGRPGMPGSGCDTVEA